MILQCAVRAATQSAETAAARTRDLLHITNAQHGAVSRAVPVSCAGQQAAGGRSGRKTAPQMPLRGRSSHRLKILNMAFTWWSYGDSSSGPLACHESLTHSLTRPYAVCFFQAEDGIRDYKVTGVQTCALPI